jgi:hypothetical protein
MPSITFEPPLTSQDDKKLNRVRKEVRKILGTDFFMYSDDYLFLVDDAIRFKMILRAIKRNVTPFIVARLRETVSHVMNVLITVFGPPGTGKSTCALTIACMMQYLYFLKDIDSHIYICFTDKEVNEKLIIAKPGDIILQDERPQAHGKGVRITADSINNIRKAVRAKRINWIGVTPNEMHDMVVNLKFETLGYNEEYQINRMLVRGGRNNTLIGTCYFKKFVPDALMKEYDDMKMSNIDDLLDAGGVVGQQGKVEAEALKKDAKKLFDYIRVNNIPISDKVAKAQREIRALYSFAGVTNPSADYLKDLGDYIGLVLKMGGIPSEPEEAESALPSEAPAIDPIDATNAAIDAAIEDELKIITPKPPTTLPPEEEHPNGFTFDLVSAFSKIKCVDRENKIMQYQLAYSGNSIDKIFDICNARQHSMQADPISMDQIRKNIRYVALAVNRALGDAWALHAFNEYKKIQGIVSVKKCRKGMIGKDDPDSLLEFEGGVFFVINEKATALEERQCTYYPDDFRPELKKAEELLSHGKEVKLFIHFYNTFYQFESMYPIDIVNPQPVVIDIPEE